MSRNTPKWRLVVQDSAGTNFRLLNIGAHVDQYGDRYLKISFPDLKNVLSGFFHKPSGVNKSDLAKREFQPIIEAMSVDTNEYSFHFGSCEVVAHFKERLTDKKIQQERRAYPMASIIEILSIDIYDFSQNQAFTKHPSLHDLVLDHPLLSPTRFRIICFPNDVNYQFKIDNSPTTILAYQHSIDTGKLGMRLLILEEDLLDIPPEAKGLVIYRLDIRHVDKAHTEHTRESFQQLITSPDGPAK